MGRVKKRKRNIDENRKIVLLTFGFMGIKSFAEMNEFRGEEVWRQKN